MRLNYNLPQYVVFVHLELVFPSHRPVLCLGRHVTTFNSTVLAEL